MKHVRQYKKGLYTVLELDHQKHDYNVIDEQMATDFCTAMKASLAVKDCKGIILTSAKDTFCSGADIQLLSKINHYKNEVQTIIKQIHAISFDMESSSIPIVAAMPGTAVGGGLELVLACQYRIAVDDTRSRYGLPEIKLGIFPGFGGSQRLPRLIGIQKSLELMLKGSTLPAFKAKALGILDETVEKEHLLTRAVSVLDDMTVGQSPWMKPTFTLKDMPHSYSGMPIWSAAIHLARAQSKGHYPAVKALLSSVYEGIQLDMENALVVEREYFMGLLNSPIPEHLIHLYLSQKQLSKKTQSEDSFEKVAIIGSGLMGSGIASVACIAGLEVCVVDTSLDKAKQSIDYLKRILNAALKRKRYTKDQVDEIVSRLSISDEMASIKGCSMVIEAVFESIDVKDKVFKAVEKVVDDDVIIASNTSSIPISELAKSLSKPDRFIGLHFFSPVEKMSLIEIIKGDSTGNKTVTRAKAFSQHINKTPIVVNDGCGFYTTRVFARYPQEALICLTDGIHPAVIEQAGRVSGMPMGPLEISDAVGLDVMCHIMKVAKEYNIYHDVELTQTVIDTFVNQSRLGKKSKKGFYDYTAAGSQLWDGSFQWLKTGKAIDMVELSQRLIYGQLVETIKCWDESILTHEMEADLGAVLGWGFAPYSGGPTALIKAIGWDRFVSESDTLADKYGERFRLPQGMSKPTFIK